MYNIWKNIHESTQYLVFENDNFELLNSLNLSIKIKNFMNFSD